MTTILFERAQHTYLPEIEAYIRFLQSELPHVRAYTSTDIHDFHPLDFDVVWRFMGMDIGNEGRHVVHEYNSLSTGRFARLKNLVKRTANRKPDQRVFLNKIVRQGFPFRDDVPFGYRDMGVAAAFFDVRLKPEYDFVYAGSVHRGPEVLQMLDHFADVMTDASILIVGTANPDVVNHYKRASNIHFAGRVHYEEVPTLMAQGRYGLNLVPDHYPFNVQTATKVLEYCALGLPVVSMRYRWAEHFVGRKDAEFFWLDHDFKNLTLRNVNSFDFVVPSVEHKRWKSVIERSQIFDFLK